MLVMVKVRYTYQADVSYLSSFNRSHLYKKTQFGKRDYGDENGDFSISAQALKMPLSNNLRVNSTAFDQLQSQPIRGMKKSTSVGFQVSPVQCLQGFGQQGKIGWTI